MSILGADKNDFINRISKALSALLNTTEYLQNGLPEDHSAGRW